MATVTIGIEWRLRCPACHQIFVTALGSREAFDETTEIGVLNRNTMRASACGCGYRPPRAITPLPLELEHSYLVAWS